MLVPAGPESEGYAQGERRVALQLRALSARAPRPLAPEPLCPLLSLKEPLCWKPVCQVSELIHFPTAAGVHVSANRAFDKAASVLTLKT